MRWVDSHCHIQDFDDLGPVVSRARDAGVVAVVCVGTDLASTRLALDAARSHPMVRVTVGLHPHDASRFDEEWPSLVDLVDDETVVGIGETGFDLHYRHSPESEQEKAFRHHIRLAKDADKALVIHTREAWDATFRVLDDEGAPPRTIFHCFTGGQVEAERALGFGAWLSFSGIATFPGAPEVRDAARVPPGERLLVETDAPFLTPVPHRGSRNEPAHVVRVGEALASARDETVAAIAEMTTENANRAFRW